MASCSLIGCLRSVYECELETNRARHDNVTCLLAKNAYMVCALLILRLVLEYASRR